MKKSVIVTPTPDMSKSLDFYRRLNFFEFGSEGKQYFMDQDTVLEIDPSRKARAGVKLFKENWESEVIELQKLTEVVKIESGYLLSDFSGVWIYLIICEGGVDIPVEVKTVSNLGTIAGLSIEGIAIMPNYRIWSTLGFKKTMGEEESGWVSVMNDDGLGISLMAANSCPHLFFNPSLTYFNSGKNLGIIKKLRDLEIPFTEEITFFNKEGIVDNLVIRDPGGLGFFVFND